MPDRKRDARGRSRGESPAETVATACPLPAEAENIFSSLASPGLTQLRHSVLLLGPPPASFPRWRDRSPGPIIH